MSRASRAYSVRVEFVADDPRDAKNIAAWIRGQLEGSKGGALWGIQVDAPSLVVAPPDVAVGEQA